LNQIFNLQAETADVDLAFAIHDLLRKRLPDRSRVFKSVARTRRRNDDPIVMREARGKKRAIQGPAVMMTFSAR
jgi:hypothetical protein